MTYLQHFTFQHVLQNQTLQFSQNRIQQHLYIQNEWKTKKGHLEELLIYLGITFKMHLQETGCTDETWFHLAQNRINKSWGISWPPKWLSAEPPPLTKLHGASQLKDSHTPHASLHELMNIQLLPSAWLNGIFKAWNFCCKSYKSQSWGRLFIH